MMRLVRLAAAAAIATIFLTFSPFAAAQVPASAIGVVIMHGKGGSPARHVSELAGSLQDKGYQVANLDMPWSGRREYDVDVATAEQEVLAALESLRSKGARKVFVAGHSQGGVFAFYFGSKHPVDGVIAIAPGGDVGNQVFREHLGAAVSRARQLIAEGKGGEKTELQDYEGAKGVMTVRTTPAAYLTWFDPQGAMNSAATVRAINPKTPVLYVGPTNDYPGLMKMRQSIFSSLPANPLTRLYEPRASHIGAPSASRDEIMRWTLEVANAPAR